MDTIDFKRELKELYRAGKTVREVVADRGTFICVDGQGEPGNETFQDAIGQLFSVAYTMKFTLKFAGVIDFAVPPLECLWYDDPKEVPVTEWRWRVLIRVPDSITAGHVKQARATIKEKKGLDTSGVKRVTWKEGRCLQVLHVGPYDRLGAVYKQLVDHAAELGLTGKGPGHEIYLSDPRRVAPERIKTIVRIAVK